MNFTSVQDVQDVAALVREAIDLKKDPLAFRNLGRDKTLGLVFMNPSLRTRLSTQKAASNLGMNVMAVNADRDNWAIEFQDGAVMNGTTVEHIRDAAPVLGSYCDIMGIRCFPGLVSRDTNSTRNTREMRPLNTIRRKRWKAPILSMSKTGAATMSTGVF